MADDDLICPPPIRLRSSGTPSGSTSASRSAIAMSRIYLRSAVWMSPTGVVKVTAVRRLVGTRPLSNDNLHRKGAPLRQCGRASLFVNLPGDEMALLIEMVVDLGVN